MDKAERISEILDSMNDNDLVEIFNEVEGSNEWIFPMWELESRVECWDITEIIELGANGFDPSASFFKDGFYGMDSGEAWDLIDTFDLASDMLEKDMDCHNDEIRAILDEDEEDEADDEAKSRCYDCACLVAGENGEWICDECGCDVHDVEGCPEGL